jgi:hypothetical protein
VDVAAASVMVFRAFGVKDSVENPEECSDGGKVAEYD